MNFNSIHRIYFLGIGGIGMSALARYFLSEGKQVSGYDRVSTQLTQILEREGMHITYDDATDRIPEPVKNYPGETLVIYTPAIPADHPQWLFFKEKGYMLRKRAEILGEISSVFKTIAVAGTHGKTTVSTLIAHLLQNSTIKCNAFLGGISKNFNTNMVRSQSQYMVAEADEYDRSFLQLSPYCGVITAMDADHLDIYGTYASVQKAFNDFIERFSTDGFLLMKMRLSAKIPSALTVFSYHVDDKEADYYASNITYNGHSSTFDLHCGNDKIFKSLTINIPGRVNVENAVAASAIANRLGVGELELRSGLTTFTGIQRRFDVCMEKPVVYIDDYAHHPAELEAFITSVRAIYPQRRLTGIFQPHLFSRTRDFALEFAQSLSLLDELVLLPIYPAREKPIPGVSSEMIQKHVTLEKKTIERPENIIGYLNGNPPDVLLTMGAGNIDLLRKPIVDWLTEKHLINQKQRHT